MSYKWGLICEKCDEGSPRYYLGDRTLRAIVHLWPQIAALEKAINESDALWEVSITIEPTWEDVGPKRFLSDHYEHGALALYSNQGDYEVLELGKEEVSYGENLGIV